MAGGGRDLSLGRKEAPRNRFLYLLFLFLSLKYLFIKDFPGDSVVKTPPFNAGGAGSIPGQGVNTPHTLWPKNQNLKQKQYCNKFNKDFKNGPHQKKIFKKFSCGT